MRSKKIFWAHQPGIHICIVFGGLFLQRNFEFDREYMPNLCSKYSNLILVICRLQKRSSCTSCLIPFRTRSVREVPSRVNLMFICTNVAHLSFFSGVVSALSAPLTFNMINSQKRSIARLAPCYLNGKLSTVVLCAQTLYHVYHESKTEHRRYPTFSVRCS